jgi:hypothetical protein
MRRIPPPVSDEYLASARRACFVCEIVAGRDDRHTVLYEDELAIAFLNRFPTVYGYVIVAPREHREHVTSDFSEDQYAAFQRVVHRVGEAVRRAVSTERLYLLSLGSQREIGTCTGTSSRSRRAFPSSSSSCPRSRGTKGSSSFRRTSDTSWPTESGTSCALASIIPCASRRFCSTSTAP